MADPSDEKSDPITEWLAAKPAGSPAATPKAPQLAKGARTSDLKALAQQYTAAALERLVALANDPRTPSALVERICEYLIDRGHGKPTVALDATIREMDKLDDAALERIIAAARDGGDGPDAAADPGGRGAAAAH